MVFSRNWSIPGTRKLKFPGVHIVQHVLHIVQESLEDGALYMSIRTNPPTTLEAPSSILPISVGILIINQIQV